MIVLTSSQKLFPPIPRFPDFCQNSQNLSGLPFHDNYILASSHLCCTNYNHIYQSSLFELIKKEVSNIQECSSILGFASVFLVVKCYANFLSAEISQLCYEGIIRTIALGRMFNVLGSSIDGYLELSLSAFFSSNHVIYSSFKNNNHLYLKFGIQEFSSYPVIYPLNSSPNKTLHNISGFLNSIQTYSSSISLFIFQTHPTIPIYLLICSSPHFILGILVESKT